jgi:hypothetical protein
MKIGAKGCARERKNVKILRTTNFRSLAPFSPRKTYMAKQALNSPVDWGNSLSIETFGYETTEYSKTATEGRMLFVEFTSSVLTSFLHVIYKTNAVTKLMAK